MALGSSSIINLGDNTKDSQKSLFSEQECDSIKKYYPTRYKKIEYIMPEEACAEAWDTIIAIVRENNLFLGSEYISSLKASETITNKEVNIMALGLSSILNLGSKDDGSQKSIFTKKEWQSLKKYYCNRYTAPTYIMPRLKYISSLKGSSKTDPKTFKFLMNMFNLTENLDRLPLISNNKQSEIDYSVQNISILLRFVFNSKLKVNIAWEKPSITNQDTSGKTVTHHFLIYSNYQELGCGEIKVNGVGERLQEEDRARLGERLKRQLHHRIKEAKSRREFYVFSVFITDNIMELYRSSFSKENGYDLVLLSKIMLPTLGSTYTSIKESLEILFSFKESIINAMQDPSECERPYIYREYYNYLKPTVSFI
ncbi:hypothetical protein EDC94DRAFT_580436 [Helicostylum pulchrum]|nr:hypothetical protein EDC94DRAFT_580436 [Helicostylum pulchrum]